MQKLTIAVDLDLVSGKNEAAEIIENLIGELEIIRDKAHKHILFKGASGLVLSPLEDDELAGSWQID
jgi:hypothetical protein